MANNNYGEDVGRKQLAEKLMAYLPTSMKKSARRFTNHELNADDFLAECHQELQRVKRAQEAHEG
jgi:hypothetical protein